MSYYYNRGLDYRDSGEYYKAIADYDYVISLEPDHADAYFQRGYAYGKLKRFSESISDYSKYIELEPNYANVYYNRANTYDNMGEYSKAISDYTKAIEIDPNYANVYYNRANTYDNMGEYSKAVSDYTKFIQLEPNDADAYHYRGLSYESLGETEKAWNDHQMAADIDPTSYTPPPPITEPPPPPMFDAIDLLPVSISGYSTEMREKGFMTKTDLDEMDLDYCRETNALASYINIENENMEVFVLAFECDSKDDAESDAFGFYWDMEDEKGIEFMETTLEDNVYGQWALNPEGDDSGATFVWNHKNFLMIAYVWAEDGVEAFDAGRHIANSIILQSPVKTPPPPNIDAIDVLPTSISGYSTEKLDEDVLTETELEDLWHCGQTSAEGVYQNIGNENIAGRLVVIECDSEEDAEDDALTIQWIYEDEEGIDFMEFPLEKNINAEWGLTTEGEVNVAIFIWNQNNYIMIAMGATEGGEDAFDVGKYIANSAILQSPL
ncbi:MAG: tetratricopeptide repeat protein [Candidatus Hydrothermarchaeales archaeon]